MKAGTLPQAIAQAAIENAEDEIRSIVRLQPAKEERDATRAIRMLPRTAEVLRQRIRGRNLGLRDPRSIAQRRNTLYAMLGGKVQLRPAQVADGEKPYRITRLGLNHEVPLQAAGSCLECGSGGRLQLFPQEEGAAASGIKWQRGRASLITDCLWHLDHSMS